MTLNELFARFDKLAAVSHPAHACSTECLRQGQRDGLTWAPGGGCCGQDPMNPEAGTEPRWARSQGVPCLAEPAVGNW